MLNPLRQAAAADIDALLELNESAVPAVNSLSHDEMAWFVASADWFGVIDDDEGVAAFLIGLRAGSTYASPNYRWFCRHYPDFAYVDRVAVAPRARRRGLASLLYTSFADTARGDVDVMTCEVNLRPPNPGSMAFHERRGFRQVGTQQTEGGRKEVALLELPL